MTTRSTLLACLVGAALAPPGLLPAQQLTAPERAQAVATVWAEARYNFAYWDRVRADWDSALAANLRLATESQSDLRFYRRLRRFIAVLGDSRAAILAPPNLRSRIARPPLLLTSVERRPFVMDFAENDEMRVARPERRSEILSVQGLPAETWIRDSVLPEISAATPPDRWQRAVAWMLQGERGTTLQLVVRPPSGEPRGLSVTRSFSLNDRWPLEPPAFAVESPASGMTVVRIGTLADDDIVRQFDRTFPDFRAVQALVLDLRAASDGKTEYAYQLLARLTDQPFAAVRWKTPAYRAAFRAWNLADSAMSWYAPAAGSVANRSDHPAYGGPIAVLASNATGGAAEDFLAAFHAARRGVIIGEPSAGSAGDVATFALPKGWGVQLCVTRHTFPDGTEFAGVGVPPDILGVPTVDALLARSDLALERARTYFEGGGERP